MRRIPILLSFPSPLFLPSSPTSPYDRLPINERKEQANSDLQLSVVVVVAIGKLTKLTTWWHLISWLRTIWATTTLATTTTSNEDRRKAKTAIDSDDQMRRSGDRSVGSRFGSRHAQPSTAHADRKQGCNLCLHSGTQQYGHSRALHYKSLRNGKEY